MNARRIPADVLYILLLAILCLLYYWRLLTPNPLNQQSLTEGDFSGQFVAFAYYQTVRLGAGQVPLWNPYTLGGHPFLADTQSAVFYPPRLVTVALLNLGGQVSAPRVYNALQIEMVTHAFLASLLMYAFVRRLTLSARYSPVAGLVSAVTFTYGGYLTGYPQLQLAILEAGIWLPLALLGMHEATRNPNRPRWFWFVVAGMALALSLLAGHPQTSLFFIYTALGYLVWRVITTGMSLRTAFVTAVVGAVIFGGIGAGIAAVQLLPGWEYLGFTTRGAMTFDEMGNGFPFYDALQVLFPGLFSLWSPLYFGIAGLMLALYGVLRRPVEAIFWLAVMAAGVALSFGARTIVYDILYNFLPGLSLFRGQERAAYVIAVAAAVLAGRGALVLLSEFTRIRRRYMQMFGLFIAPALSLSATLLFNWLTTATPDETARRFELAAFSLVVAALAAGAYILIGWHTPTRSDWRPVLILGVILFELFSFGRRNPNFEPKPTTERLPTPPLVARVAGEPGIFRVDGLRGVRENYGALFGVQDIRGISPLRLETVESLLELPNLARAWEVFAVRYVFTDNRELPAPSVIEARGSDPLGAINLHRLESPRPFARLVYRTWIEPDEAAARGILSEPAFDSNNTVILANDPAAGLPETPPEGGRAAITSFAPEAITIQTDSPAPAILNVALVDYPGWEAKLDGQPIPILRADTAMSGIVVPPGTHTVELTFAPRSYQTGAMITLVTLVACAALLAVSGVVRG